MVRKITPTASGWGKRPAAGDHQRAFETTAVRALAALPSHAPAWRDSIIAMLNAPIARRRLSPVLLAAFQLAVTEIVDLETPTVPVAAAGPTALEAVAYRSRLRALLAFQTDADRLLRAWTSAIAGILRQVADAVPDAPANVPGIGTVPLIDLMSSSVSLVADIVAGLIHFAPDDPATVQPGAVLAGYVKQMLLDLSSVSEEAARKNPRRLISPKASGLQGMLLIEAYLGGTPFVALFKTPVPFRIPRNAYRAHTAIFGPSDHGKTQTIQHLVASFLSEPDPPALFVTDSMGTMLKKMRQLEVFQDRLKGRLVILDPAGANPPKLNFFKLSGGSPAQQMEILFYLFKALDQTLTTRMRTAVTFLTQLMRAIGGSLTDLRQVCEEKKPQHIDAINALPAAARDFFLNSFYKPDTLMTQTKAQIASRLYTLEATPLIEMFSAKDNDFNAFDCIQRKAIVLVNTDRVTLGDEGSAIFGRFVMAQCLSAAFARSTIPEDQRHLAVCIVDEAKQYVDEQTEKFLADARQFGLGLMLATQYVHQFPEGVRRAVYGNTAVKFIGPIEYGDRVSLAREMNTTPEFIGGMRAYDRSHTEWAVHVRTSNLTPSALKLTVPYGTLEAMPKAQKPLEVSQPSPKEPDPIPAHMVQNASGLQPSASLPPGPAPQSPSHAEQRQTPSGDDDAVYTKPMKGA